MRAGPTEAYSNSGLSVTRKVINFEAYKIPTQAIIFWFQMSLLTVLSFSAFLTALAWSPSKNVRGYSPRPPNARSNCSLSFLSDQANASSA
jgi:hypothetical protein